MSSVKRTQVAGRVARTVAPETSAKPTAAKPKPTAGKPSVWSELYVTVFTLVSLAAVLLLIVFVDQLLITQAIVLQCLYTAFSLFLGVAMFSVLWGRVLRRTRGNVEPLSFGERINETFWMVGLPTVALGTLTALLVQHKWLLTSTGSKSPGLAWVSNETYVWSLTNAVPVLNLTDAFNWHPQFRLAHESGRLFVLAYKLAIITPLVYWMKTFTEMQLNSADDPAERASETIVDGAEDAEQPLVDDPDLARARERALPVKSKRERDESA